MVSFTLPCIVEPIVFSDVSVSLLLQANMEIIIPRINILIKKGGFKPPLIINSMPSIN